MPRAMSHKPSPSRSPYAIWGLSREVKSYPAQKPALVSALSAQSGTADEREAHCARTVLATITRSTGRSNAGLVMVRLLHRPRVARGPLRRIALPGPCELGTPQFALR